VIAAMVSKDLSILASILQKIWNINVLGTQKKLKIWKKMDKADRL